MRRISFVVLVIMAFMAVASPLAEANKYSEKSGSKFSLKKGQKKTVKVIGFQGCTFEVLHTNSGTGPGDTDSSVATVKTSGKLAKSQVVTITAVGVGETVVELVTQGQSPSCNGFTATYFISVPPDQAAFDKLIRSKLKDILSNAKTDISSTLSSFCDLVNSITKAVKAGTITPAKALSDVTAAMQTMATYFDLALHDALDKGFVDVWDCVSQEGFMSMNGDLSGLLPGGCGEWDKLIGKVQVLADKSILKMEKKYKALVNAINKVLKAGGSELVQSIERIKPNLAVRTPVAIPEPVVAPPPPPPPKALKKNFSSSARDSNIPGAPLHIGGSADPAGGDVTVKITGPGGVVNMMTAPVSSPGCTWDVTFNGLPSGSYSVTLSQANGDSVTFTVYAS